MLDEYKQIYIENANLIPNWREMSKSELANLYIENENNDLASSCFSALMCKYWNLIGSYYYKQDVKIASETDCYDWLIEGLTYALEKRVWKDESNVLYDDPKGPEKAMTVCITSTRATFYQYTKHDKRSLNYTLLSLDSLEENSSDGFFLPFFDKYETIHSYIKEQVIESFKKKDYFICFFLDALFNADIVVDKTKSMDYNININRFCNYINEMNDEYLHRFSNEYDIEFDRLKPAFVYIQNMPHYRIHSNINRVLNILKKDDTLHSLLGEHNV